MITGIITLSFLLALYYSLALIFRSDWNDNTAGRAELAFSSSVTLVLGLSFARALGWMAPTWLRIVAYTLIIVGLAIKAFTLTKIQNRRSSRLKRERQEISDAAAQ